MKTLRLVIWDFVQRSLNFSQVALCLTKFKSEAESSRTHFEVLGLEAQVLGFEAYKHGRSNSKGFGGAPNFAQKMTLNFARKVIGFSVQIKVTSKKKRSLLKLRQFDEYKIAQNFDANLPEKYEIAQNFNAILPK